MAHISPKFTVLFVLLCTGNTALFCMEQPTVQAQSDILLQDISHVGEHALVSIQNNRTLFEKLLASYRVSYDRVQSICTQAFERTSLELLDRVHTNALQVNCVEIKTFPACSFSFAGFPETKAYLSDEHAACKQRSCAGIDWIAQNKDRFKVPILHRSRELLANPDNTILNAVVLPRSDLSELCQHFPLSFREKANMVERVIPMEAIIAERLGLGIITMQYVKGTGEKKFLLVIEFVKKSDGHPMPLGVITLSGLHSMVCTDTRSVIENISQLEVQNYEFLIDYPNVASSSCDDKAIIAGLRYATASEAVRAVWANVGISSWAPAAGSKEFLSTLLDTELVNLRKAAVCSLLAQTELGTVYARALEELDACYNALVAFGSIAGFSEQEKAAVERLVNKNNFMTYHQHYCAAHMSEADSPLLTLPAGTIEASSATILARFATQSVPASVVATAEQRENAFATPLRVLLARIGYFAVMYPESARQAREEVARLVAETAECARRVQIVQQVQPVKAAQSVDLMQENQRLEEMVGNLSAQVAHLTAMMQQLLIQRVAQ